MPNTFDLEGLFSSTGDIDERRAELAETKKQEAEFLESTTKANDNDREIIMSEFGDTQPTFEVYYRSKIVSRLRGLVQRAESDSGKDGLVAACERRGIEAMVEFRSLATAGGVSLSYQSARVFGEMSEKGRRRKGDSPDLHHALLSSAADKLVTHDRDFAFWFSRVPNKGVAVLDHLHKLLDRL